MARLIVLVAVVAGGSALAVIAMQRRRIAELERELHGAVEPAAAEVITIEIRNHSEIAAGRTALARPLAVLTPGLLRSIVHRETLKMLRSELADNGVEADVRLRRLEPRESDETVSPDPD